MWMELDGDGALYGQVYRALRREILDGHLASGSRLPSSRTLASDSQVARNTVIQAYQQLIDEGYAETRRGSGTFVCESLPEDRLAAGPPATSARRHDRAGPPLSQYGERLDAVMPPGGPSWSSSRPRLAYDFRYGDPGLLDLPYATWCRSLNRAARAATPRELGYAPPGGAPELRRALAHYLARSRGVRCDPEQVLVLSGSQQAIDLTARVLLDPGETVVLEEPHYPGFRLSLAAAGARICSVAVDDAGLPPEALPPDGARGVCVTPSHQFPSGAVMPLSRRLALLAWAQTHNAWVLEDDYDGEFRYDGRPLASLQGLDDAGRVLYAGTTSKLLFPSLRIGYLVVPERWVDVFQAAKAFADTGGGGLEQRTLARFIEDGAFDRHLRRARKRNGERRRTLLESIERELGDTVEVGGANAGLHVVVWLRAIQAGRFRAIRSAAAERGVGIYPVAPYYRRPPRRAGMMLGYAALDPRAIREGIRRLAATIEESRGDGVSPTGRGVYSVPRARS